LLFVFLGLFRLTTASGAPVLAARACAVYQTTEHA